jgi:hypothetical protein
MQKYDELMKEMIKDRIIVETPCEELLWVNPTHPVPMPNGKRRLVVDLRAVNKFLVHRHFKMEGVLSLKDLLKKDDYATSFDLTIAYNDVPVHPSIILSSTLSYFYFYTERDIYISMARPHDVACSQPDF